MPLLLFLILFFAVESIFRLSVGKLLYPVSQKLHSFCLNLVPINAQSIQEISALVCGQNFLTAETSSIYSSTGLIHLFVVSGAHLILLDTLLKKLFVKSFLLRLLLLAVYCACCELNPPVVRSWFVLLLTFFFRKSLNVQFKSHLLFIIGLVCLCFNPTWITSLSLQLSWLIALAILINQQIFPGNNLLLHQFSYYLVVLPTISTFQSYSPYSVVLNMFFAPFLEFILFPLAILTLIVNPIYPVFDFLIQALRSILNHIEMNSSSSVFTPDQSIHLINWTMIFLIHLILHLDQISKLRKTYV